jgi:hypothetical protein
MPANSSMSTPEQNCINEWENIEIEGEALADQLGKFGTWTVREQMVTP